MCWLLCVLIVGCCLSVVVVCCVLVIAVDRRCVLLFAGRSVFVVCCSFFVCRLFAVFARWLLLFDGFCCLLCGA